MMARTIARNRPDSDVVAWSAHLGGWHPLYSNGTTAENTAPNFYDWAIAVECLHAFGFFVHGGVWE